MLLKGFRCITFHVQYRTTRNTPLNHLDRFSLLCFLNCFISLNGLFFSYLTILFRASCAFRSDQLSNKNVDMPKCFPISRFVISVCVILTARCLLLLQNTFHCLSVDGLTSVFIKLNNLSPQFHSLKVPVKLSFSYIRMDVLITSKSVNTVWVNFRKSVLFRVHNLIWWAHQTRLHIYQIAV